MKTLILVLFLLFSGVVKSQTYEVDSIAHYPNLNEMAYSVKPKGGNIKLGKEFVTFNVDTFNFKAKITDTLDVIVYADLSFVRGFKVVEQNKPLTKRLFTIYYDDGKIIAIAITSGRKLDIFHILGIKEENQSELKR